MSIKIPKNKSESTGDRTADFLLEQGEFASPGAIDEIWADIIDGSIDDQHAQMEKVGMLPEEWKKNHAESKRKKQERRIAESAKQPY